MNARIKQGPMHWVEKLSQAGKLVYRTQMQFGWHRRCRIAAVSDGLPYVAPRKRSFSGYVATGRTGRRRR